MVAAFRSVSVRRHSAQAENAARRKNTGASLRNEAEQTSAPKKKPRNASERADTLSAQTARTDNKKIAATKEAAEN
jgi:hypothetical protein